MNLNAMTVLTDNLLASHMFGLYYTIYVVRELFTCRLLMSELLFMSVSLFMNEQSEQTMFDPEYFG